MFCAYKCELLLGVWHFLPGNLEQGFRPLKFLSCYLQVFPLPQRAAVNHRRSSLGKLWDLSLLCRAWCQPPLWIQCFGTDWQFPPHCWEGTLMPWSLLTVEGWRGLRETEVFILVWCIVLYLVTIPAFLFEASSTWLSRLYLHSPPLHT